VDGDATSMPFGDESFSAAVYFTMLHYVPSSAGQDRVFAEVRRVLRQGATFAGTDSRGRRLGWKLLHVGDLKLVIEPDDLERRLVAAGFEDVQVETDRDSYRFRAYRPTHAA
jgi:SAM-dependent methyltransferase